MWGCRALKAAGFGRARSAVACMVAGLLAGSAVAEDAGTLAAMRLEIQGSESGDESVVKPGKPEKPEKPDKPGRPDSPVIVVVPAEQPESDGCIVVESDIRQAVGTAILGGVAVVLSSPFVIPRAAMGDDGWKRGRFTEYPYSDGPGYLSIPEVEDDGPIISGPIVSGHRNLACTAGLAYAKEDAVETFRGDFQLRTSARAGIRVGYTNLVEDLGGGATDELSVGDATVLIRFAQHEKAQMRFGIGYLSTLDDGDEGAIFVYEGDFFPAEPFVISGGFDVGGLGDATYSRWHLGLGVVGRGVEFSLGYSSQRTGSVELEGPTVGARMWF